VEDLETYREEWMRESVEKLATPFESKIGAISSGTLFK